MSGCEKRPNPLSPPHPIPTGETASSDSTVPTRFTIPAGSTTVPVLPVSSTVRSWTPRAQERDWQSIVLHHTASEVGSVASIHEIHRQRKDAAGKPWRGIGYHFVIGNGHGMDDGAVEATFRWQEQLEGAHAGVSRYNEAGIGICLVGNFEEHPPSDAQISSLRQLIDWLSHKYDISVQQVKGHGELKPTACPGKFFPLQEFVLGRPTALLRPPSSERRYSQL